MSEPRNWKNYAEAGLWTAIIMAWCALMVYGFAVLVWAFGALAIPIVLALITAAAVFTRSLRYIKGHGRSFLR